MADSLVDVRGCSACGSKLCTRDEECPTCETCGRRGHLHCTSVVASSPLMRPAWEGVAEDLRDRDRIGRERYGSSLRGTTDVDLLQYAYEEALDCAIYLRGEIDRRKAGKS